MLSLLRKRRPVVQRHWFVPLPDFQSDVAEFYGAIEAAIRERKLPPMQIVRIPWREGGLLSEGREYLRVMRERLVFDIGCGPFGSYWFYSCRGAVIPRALGWSDVLVALLTLGSFFGIYWLSFGWTLGWIVLVATFAAMVAMMLVAGSWPGLDEMLIHMPVVGTIYESLFRRQTYFREDTRLMWLTTVNSIVKEKVSESAKAGGVEEVRFEEVGDPSQPLGIRDLAASLAREFVSDMKGGSAAKSR